MLYRRALKGGGEPCPPPSTKLRDPGVEKPPWGSWQAIQCISAATPSTKQPRFLLCINTKLQNNIHTHMNLHTLFQVSFTSCNATNHSSILSPYNSTIPFFITILCRHLEWLSTLIVDVCSFLGSLRDHSLHSRPIRLLLLLCAFPNDHRRQYA